MTWIESHQSLRDHPKTRKLARLLGVSRPQTIGHLHCLWWWALDYAEDGRLDRFDAIDIAIGAEWEGEASVFVDGMIDVGFLEDDAAGGMVIHDWYDYAGKLIERRKANALRMRRARAENDQSTNGARAANGADTDDARARNSGTRAAHVQRTQRARAELPNPTVPTQPNPTGESPPSGAPLGADAPPEPDVPAGPRPMPKPRAHRLPDDFTVTAEMRDLAVGYGVAVDQVDRETDRFRDHFRGAGSTKVDWSATWRNWMRRAVDLNESRRSPPNVRQLGSRGGWTPQETAAYALRLEAEGK